MRLPESRKKTAKCLKGIALVKAFRGSMSFIVGASIVSVSKSSDPFGWTRHASVAQLKSVPFFDTVINWVTSFTKDQILAVGLLAFALGLLRWIEAASIWKKKRWGAKLAIVTGALYIPFEINQLFLNFSWLMAVILMINLIIITYLIHVLNIAR